MAPSVTATALIRVAPGSVWKTWLDLNRWSRWQPETVEAAWQAGQPPWKVGSTFALLRRTPYGFLRHVSGARARRFVGQVLSVADEQLLVWELHPTSAAWFGPVLVESVRLAPAPSGATVTLTLTAHGLGPSLLGPLLTGPLHAQAQATLAGLQRLLAPAARRL